MAIHSVKDNKPEPHLPRRQENLRSVFPAQFDGSLERVHKDAVAELT